MTNKIIKKFFTVITISVSLLGLIVGNLNAQTIILPGEVGFPTPSPNVEADFGLPDGIIIIPIYVNPEEYISYEDFYKGLYFYTTDVLGFSDIPFHYVITENGEIYKGNSVGEERKINVVGFETPKVYVAYLTTSKSIRFSNQASKSITSLLTSIANNNTISPDLISVSEFKFVRNTEQGVVSIEKQEAFGAWQSSLSAIIPAVKIAYSPKAKTYNVDVDSITLPEGEVKPGETISLAISLTNQGQFGIYGGTDNEIIATKADGGNSKFFLNNAWVSGSQFPMLTETQNLLPSQQLATSVQIRVPLVVGEIAESFQLRNLRGEVISLNVFEIRLNVQRSDRQIVEVGPTETGNLNVRDQASSASNVISQVSTGQRFFLLEDAGNGWLRIEIDQQTSGWVAGWYLTYL